MAFNFNTQDQRQFFIQLLDIADKYKNNEGFIGEVSKRISELRAVLDINSFLDNLDKNLKTVKKYDGFKVETAWDGGFENFGENDDLFRLERIAIYLCIYIREFSFRKNFKIDQGDNFYPLYQFVRKNRDEFSEKSLWCFEFYDDLPSLIMQDEFHSPHAIAISRILANTDIAKVEEFIRTKDDSISKIDTWNSEYQQKEAAVNLLKDKLETYQTAFNFVGLYQGFSTLKTDKEKLLPTLEKRYEWFASGLILIPILELIWILFNFESLSDNLDSWLYQQFLSSSVYFIFYE